MLVVKFITVICCYRAQCEESAFSPFTTSMLPRNYTFNFCI